MEFQRYVSTGPKSINLYSPLWFKYWYVITLRLYLNAIYIVSDTNWFFSDDNDVVYNQFCSLDERFRVWWWWWFGRLKTSKGYVRSWRCLFGFLEIKLSTFLTNTLHTFIYNKFYIYIFFFSATKNKIYRLNIIFELERLLPALCLFATRTSFFIHIEGREDQVYHEGENGSRHLSANPLPVVKISPESWSPLFEIRSHLLTLPHQETVVLWLFQRSVPGSPVLASDLFGFNDPGSTLTVLSPIERRVAGICEQNIVE